ncbi:MAG: DUF5808 domain-containing protein [Gemmatimonadaceae bacterium]
MAEDSVNDSEWENPANWFGGWFYHSQLDTRTLVPKRVPGFGVTINLARPGGLAIAIAIPILIAALIVTAWQGY